MSRVLTAIFPLVITFFAAAQTTSGPGSQGAATAAAAASNGTEGPIKISVGPQSDGSMGVTVNGASYYVVRSLVEGAGTIETSGGFVQPSAFIYFNPALDWSSKTDAKNEMSISARPTLQFGYQRKQTIGSNGIPTLVQSDVWPSQTPFADIYFDARWQAQHSDGSTTTATSSTATEATTGSSATFYGIGASIAVPFLSRHIERANPTDVGVFPMLRITYYRTRDAALPSGVKANALDAALKFSLPLHVITIANVTSRFDFDGDLSRPTSGANRKWQKLIKTALMFQMGKSDFKPALSYTSGEKLGFKYDRQLLLGIAFDLSKQLGK